MLLLHHFLQVLLTLLLRYMLALLPPLRRNVDSLQNVQLMLIFMRRTDTAEVVGDGIPFANGAVVTYDRSGVLVSALSARQIRFYPISPQSSVSSRPFFHPHFS